MKYQALRIALDLVLSAIIVFEMFYTLTGNLLHELVGALFFVTLVVHIVLSRKWFKGVSTKRRTDRRLTAKQKAKLIMSVVLGIACTVLLASSVLISNVLSGFTGWQLGIDTYSWWVYIHTLCAYAVCIFAICHVGLHWVGVFKALKIPYSAERRNAINVGVTSMAAFGVFALGSAAAKALNVLPAGVMENYETYSAESASSVTPNENGTSNDLGKKEAGEQGNLGSGTTKDNSSHGFRRGQKNGPRTDNGYDSDRGYGSDIGSDVDSDSSLGNGTRSEGGSSNAGSGNGSSGSTSSICTLCHKRCPLSAPRCSKPYDAGLITR